MIKKSFSLLPSLTFALIVCITPAFSSIVLDTTITILNPSEGSQILSFPQLGFNIEFKATLAGTCPNATIEGRLQTADNSNATVTSVGDSAALFLTINSCINAPLLIPDINGKVFEVKTLSKTYTLTVSDANNNAIQFVFDDPSVGIQRLHNLTLTPGGKRKYYNGLGRRVLTSSQLFNQRLFSQ